MNIPFENCERVPDDEYKYFLYEENHGVLFFKSIEERENAFQTIKDNYLDDEWDEAIELIVAGEVTHTTEQIKREDRPANLDEDNCDENGGCWGNFDYFCDYSLIPLKTKE